MPLKLFIAALLAVPALLSVAPAPAPICADVHEGLFRTDSEVAGSTIIRRDQHYQLETNRQQNLEIRYRVHWKDDCTYQLTFDKLLKGPTSFVGAPNDTITVRILSVGARSYRIAVSANFSEYVMNSEVQRM